MCIVSIENEVKIIAKCPECGGLAKWRSPFYVCTVCGLALSRRDYERMHDKQKSVLYDAQLEEHENLDKKRKKEREYLDWYLGSKD